MDMYGIGAAVKAAFRMYQMGARQSGRTTSLLESLKDGDRVICQTFADARWMEIRAREFGSKVEFVVISMDNIPKLRELGTSQGRTLFTHDWLEAFYEKEIAGAIQLIDEAQRRLSGFGLPHIETRLKARELSRWNS